MNNVKQNSLGVIHFSLYVIHFSNTLKFYAAGGYALNIFNRWGGTVFSSTSGYDSWNGQDEKGKAAPTGIYVYTFKITNDPSQKSYSGTVMLVR